MKLKAPNHNPPCETQPAGVGFRVSWVICNNTLTWAKKAFPLALCVVPRKGRIATVSTFYLFAKKMATHTQNLSLSLSLQARSSFINWCLRGWLSRKKSFSAAIDIWSLIPRPFACVHDDADNGGQLWLDFIRWSPYAPLFCYHFRSANTMDIAVARSGREREKEENGKSLWSLKCQLG